MLHLIRTPRARLWLTGFAVALVTAVAVALIGMSVFARAQGSVANGSRPDAPPYGVAGPYAVGTRQGTVGDANPIDLTTWYPATAGDAGAQLASYSYAFKWPMPPGTTASVAGRALPDAPPADTGAPAPLVVLSPGFAIGTAGYAWLGEQLASHGFVVMAPEHRERMDPELSGFWRGSVTRPGDVRAVLAHADALAAPGGWLAGRLDPQTVAVVGHSYGGYTALAAAGARIDAVGFAARCERARAADDPAAWLCDLFDGRLGEMAELAGLDTLPAGVWPTLGDPRVDAAVSLAGDAYLFGDAGLAEITVPVLALGGTGDTGTPWSWGSGPTYDRAASAVKARVGFEHAEHMIFAADCDALPIMAAIGAYSFCSDPVWDMNRAHDLIAHFTTAFLRAHLLGDADAAAALAPAEVAFPGVSYDAEGF